MEEAPPDKVVTIQVDANCKVTVDDDPTMKKDKVLKWTCAHPYAVIFDGYPGDATRGNKFDNGPFQGGKRIFTGNQTGKIRPHSGSDLIHYKYSIVVFANNKVCTADPEVIVDPR